MADYIVEQGTVGIWTYRKWHSGIAECWGQYSTKIAVDVSQENGFRSEIIYISLPFQFFGIRTWGDCTDKNACSVFSTSANATTVAFNIFRFSSYAENTWYVNLHVTGKWK